MQYMIMFYEKAEVFEMRTDPAQAGAYWAGWTAYVGAMAASGIVVNGEGLQGPMLATTVRVVDGKRHVQDGPFADSKEQLGGYFIVDVPDLETALDWAARAPCAVTGSVEVRPTLPRMNPPQG